MKRAVPSPSRTSGNPRPTRKCKSGSSSATDARTSRLEDLVMKLSELEAERDRKRDRTQELFEERRFIEQRKIEIDRAMKDLEQELLDIDDRILELEGSIEQDASVAQQQQQQQQQHGASGRQPGKAKAATAVVKQEANAVEVKSEKRKPQRTDGGGDRSGSRVDDHDEIDENDDGNAVSRHPPPPPAVHAPVHGDAVKVDATAGADNDHPSTLSPTPPRDEILTDPCYTQPDRTKAGVRHGRYHSNGDLFEAHGGDAVDEVDNCPFRLDRESREGTGRGSNVGEHLANDDDDTIIDDASPYVTHHRPLSGSGNHSTTNGSGANIPNATSSALPSFNPLEIVTKPSKKAKSKSGNDGQKNAGNQTTSKSANAGTRTIEAYFGGASNNSNNTNANVKDPPRPSTTTATTTESTTNATATTSALAASNRTESSKPAPARVSSETSASLSSASATVRNPYQTGIRRNGNNATAALTDPNARFRTDDFPWSAKVNELLRATFRIRSFREQQKEIINATMEGNDVFVIMRTGGGKSLTYQLPALYEGRYTRSKKVTFVVSPLLSLIQDQEEQMNEFAPGSAVSFTSGLAGGQTEHARRWALVRDPDQGVCLVFVTPEKVHNSKKLQSEMQKLFDQGRLGRFVIDEAHCACQWGHDFRPDYAKLGLLKAHFPSIPLIAVTATASDKVRRDVCSIMRLGTNYKFFRSSAHRPNLHYSVRPKDGKAAIKDMAAFIKERYPRSAGIVYTFSRKDADTVAKEFRGYDIKARAYHSDISPSQKESIHRSWMRNTTQVVVATIAFGLGINKPDVRFVLHHAISKSLDAYYQESGRAGRDGLDSDCILYYSPKDVTRTLKMVHASNGDALVWPMIQYAQKNGNDDLCKALLMKYLGEPNTADLEERAMQADSATSELKDVARHGQTVTRLLRDLVQRGERLTMLMLIKEWRSKSEIAPQYVKDYPPSKDGLSTEDCERIIVELMIHGIFDLDYHYTAYDTVIYLIPGVKAQEFLNSSKATMPLRFPKNDSQAAAKQKSHSAMKSVPDDGEWLTTKTKAKPKATAKGKKPAAPARKKPAKRKGAPGKKAIKKNTKATTSGAAKTAVGDSKDEEVIDLFSDEEDDSDDEMLASLAAKRQKTADEEIWQDDEQSVQSEESEELEFIG